GGRHGEGRSQTLSAASWRCAACTVFVTTIATVIGPTPPGTGVRALATRDTEVASTSPQSREPPAGPSTRWMPTSTTTAPGLTHAGPRRLGAAPRRDGEMGAAGQVAEPGTAPAVPQGDRHAHAFLREQCGQRPAHDVAAAEPPRVSPGEGDLVVAQQLEDAR